MGTYRDGFPRNREGTEGGEMHACIPQVFLGTECSPEIFPRPLPRVSWVTILVPGSSGGGVGVSHPWVAGPRPGGGVSGQDPGPVR